MMAKGTPPVTNCKRITIASLLFASAAISSVSATGNCKTLDPESAVAMLVTEHAGGKVLKVEEAADANGCKELKIRILIDGTIKAITIPNKTGA